MGILDVRVGDIQGREEVTYNKKAKRTIENLHSVEWRSPRKSGRLTKLPPQAYYGVKYERAWAEYMTGKKPNSLFLAGPWIYYVDDNGWGYCQPDGVYMSDDEIFLFECKLTFTYRTRNAALN